MNIDRQLAAAENGGFALWKLNFLLLRGIPFNRPHGLRIVKITKNEAMVKLPFWRINQNHIKGMHACALATLAEYTSGLVLLRSLGSRKYRLIMKSIKVEYFFQAKMESRAHFAIEQSKLDEICQRLDSEGKELLLAEVQVKDIQGNHLCTASIEWQLKSWKSVKSANA